MFSSLFWRNLPDKTTISGILLFLCTSKPIRMEIYNWFEIMHKTNVLISHKCDQVTSVWSAFQSSHPSACLYFFYRVKRVNNEFVCQFSTIIRRHFFFWEKHLPLLLNLIIFWTMLIYEVICFCHDNRLNSRYIKMWKRLTFNDFFFFFVISTMSFILKYYNLVCILHKW